MLATFPAPVLSVTADVVRDLEGQDALSSLWALFTKCKESLKDGRRLENLSWRLWHRELSLAHTPYAPLTPDSPPQYASSDRKSASSFFAVVDGGDPEKKALPDMASPRRLPPSPTLTAEPHEDADRSPISPLRSRGGALSAASFTFSHPSSDSTASIPHSASSPSASGPGRPHRAGSFVGRILIDMLPNTVIIPPKSSFASSPSSSHAHARESSTETKTSSPSSCTPSTPPPQPDLPEMPIVQLPSTPSSDTGPATTFPRVVVVNPTPHPTPPMTPILQNNGSPDAAAPPPSTFLLPPLPAPALSATKPVPAAERSNAFSRPSHQPYQASRQPAQQQKSQQHMHLQPLATLASVQPPESLSRLEAERSAGRFFLQHSPDDVSPDRESSTASKSPSDMYDASSGGSSASAIMMQRHVAPATANTATASAAPLHADPEATEDGEDNDDAVSVAASNAPSQAPSRAGGRVRKAGGGKAGVVRPAMARRTHSSRFIPPSLQRRSSTHSETTAKQEKEKGKEKEKEGGVISRAASSTDLANALKMTQGKRSARSSTQLASQPSTSTTTMSKASTAVSTASTAKPVEPAPPAALPPVVLAPEPPISAANPPPSQLPPGAQPVVNDNAAHAQAQVQAPNGLQGRRVVVAPTSSEDYETTDESDWASEDVEVGDGDADIPVVAAAPAIVAVRSTPRSKSDKTAEHPKMTRAEREKAERARRAEETRLREAALEAQRQRDMFQKVPKRSYSNLNRSRSGLLSQLMNPDPAIFPPNHPYRQSRSAQDMSKMRGGLQPMTAHAPAQAGGRSQMPSGSGLQAAAVPAPSRMQTSKSAAAVPTQVNATVTVKSPLSNGLATGAPEKPAAPPRNAQAQPLDKVREKEREKAAAGGGYRPKGRPTEMEMEMEDTDEEEDKIQMSESIAQQKLAALASKRAPGPTTGNTSAKHRQHATDGAGARHAMPSLAQQVAQAALPLFAMHKATASAVPTAGTTNAMATPVQAQPIPLGHPYNFPVYALPMTPRTTRRQMLKTELSESLRRQLLWERQVSNQNLAGVRRSSHNSALGGGVAPMTAVRSEGRMQGQGQGQQRQGQNSGQAQAQAQAGRGDAGNGNGASRSAEEESREARRQAAFARNRSWANDYHYAGW